MSIVLSNGEENPEDWELIDSETQDNLIEWFNIREEDIEAHELQLLADLHCSGNICFINCHECGYVAFEATPEDWDNFQGTGCGMKQGIFNGTLCGDCYVEFKEKAEAYGII